MQVSLQSAEYVATCNNPIIIPSDLKFLLRPVMHFYSFMAVQCVHA